MFRKFLSSAMLIGVVAACSTNPSRHASTTATPQVFQSEENEGQLERPTPLTARQRREVERRFRLAAQETAQTSYAVSSDSDQDTEPAVTTQNINSADRTTVAFIKITNPVSPFRARIYTTSTTNLTSFPTPTALSIPASGLSGVTYTNTADPTLAYDLLGLNTPAYQMYCAGLAYNMDSYGNHPNGGVAVWRSSDGGSTWSGSTIVAETSGTHVYDKPVVAVSWNNVSFDGHGPLGGHVYVAWVDVDTSSLTGNHIYFSRSTDGGVTWSSPLTIATGFVHTPQIVVPSNTGRVFVLYARYNTTNSRTNSIEAYRSLDDGSTFSSIATLSSTNLLGPTLAGTNCSTSGDCLNGVHARSVFQARYNPGVGLQLVWHGADPNNSSQSDIYYAYYNGSWTSMNLTPSATNDQFNPAFDYDNSNNAVITWLDRRNDTNNLNYQPYFMKINTSGTVLQSAGALSSAASDPSQYTLSPSVGEYIDSWFWNGQWVSAWPHVTGAGAGDINVTRITVP